MGMSDDLDLDAIRARAEAAEAQVERLKQRLDKVREVALGRVPHRYMGGCPDALDGWDLRDPECAACAILVNVVTSP